VTEGPQDGEGDTLWHRLTRRKVVQWGIAYAAGAWGLLQGVQFLAEAFEWPTRVLKLATFALLVGLPVVLVFAWYHGDRGEQRIRRTELAIVTLLFLLGGALFWRYQSTTEESPATTTEAAAPVAAAAPADAGPSIAVLPFENRSAKQDDVFFVDGIHDDILTQLSKLSALKVISRTSVERFRDTRLPLKTIAEQLGVTKILEGGVQRAGDRVRITVQLIDAATDTHLWAESYDRKLTAANIFAIQSDVATAIAAALRTTLTPAEKARVDAIPTQNLDAWEAYQLGKQRMASRNSDGLADAEKFFRKAIHLDTTFALAYVGLADTLFLQVAYSGAPQSATLTNADGAVAAALALDPNLAEAWASSANIANMRGQYERAETMFRRAIALNPNYATAYQWFSRLLSLQGRYKEGVNLSERAVELDPLSAILNSNLGLTLDYLGRFDEASARYRKSIAIDPSMSTPYAFLANLRAYGQNHFADAVRLIEKAVQLDAGSPDARLWLADLYLDLGDDSEAIRIIESVRAQWPDALLLPSTSAYAHQNRGDRLGAQQDARRLLALDPRDSNGLQFLRNADLETGHPESARARYANAYPELVAAAVPKIDDVNCLPAIDLALVLQNTGERMRAKDLLDGSELIVQMNTRLGKWGFGIADVQIYALRGDKAKALVALREAEKAGWRGPFWRYARDFDPNLASIRNEPEFKAVFADIEHDMARQRAELAARPKDAPLDLGEPAK
jgi:TolB-like protein/Tfp pilus assembly protein PilF